MSRRLRLKVYFAPPSPAIPLLKTPQRYDGREKIANIRLRNILFFSPAKMSARGRDPLAVCIIAANYISACDRFFFFFFSSRYMNLLLGWGRRVIVSRVYHN